MINIATSSKSNVKTPPTKSTVKTTPGAPKKNKSNFEVNYIVPREGPLF